MREWLTRLVDWTRQGRLERELDEEIRFHEAQLTRDAADRGEPDDAALAYARARLGSMRRVREDARDRWSIPTLDQAARDLRIAARSLGHAPAFTASVVLTLSLGIGANAAMFDVTDRLMFRPLSALRDPGAVHRIYTQVVTETNEVRTSTWLPFERYGHLRDWTTSFSATAAFVERTMVVGLGEAARERRVAGVTASFFEFFDAPAVAGRYFGEAEDVAPVGAPVAVISHELWRTEYGGRPVVGESLQVGALGATIIGVAHPALAGVTDTQPAAVFVPITSMGPVLGGALAHRHSSGYGSFWGDALVRRKPGVSVEQASADATQAFRRSLDAQRAAQPDSPGANADPSRARALVSAVRPGGGPAPALEVRTALWVSGVAFVVLIIACANVANLLLSRALARGRELAVRAALGAGRGRLVSHMLAETALLTLAGLVGALVVAQGTTGAIFSLLAPAGAAIPPGLSPRLLAAVGALTLGVCLLLALMAAIATPRRPLPALLRGGPRAGAPPRMRLRATLVAVQTALTVVLLVGAALFVRSLDAVRSMPLGYDADRVLLVNLVNRGAPLDATARIALRRRLVEAAAALPGVDASAWRMSIPLGLDAQQRLFVDGIASLGALGPFTVQTATPDYFRVMGTQILRGRAFTDDDRAGTPPVAIVSAGMARTLWGDADPIGQCLRLGAETAACISVIGVAEDIVQTSLTATRRQQYYLPLDQAEPGSGTGLALRLAGDPAVEGESIRRSLQQLLPPTTALTVQPLADLVHRAQRSWRLGATMFLALGVLAAVVAAVGLFGLIRYHVVQRTHELGVRTALGAGRGDILRLVIRQNLRLALVGVVAGVGLALSVSSRIEPLLFEQSATDASVYAAVAAGLVLIAVVASALPAINAARTPPIHTLRAE